MNRHQMTLSSYIVDIEESSYVVWKEKGGKPNGIPTILRRALLKRIAGPTTQKRSP